MVPAVVVALLWLLFGGTHMGLGIESIRSRLVRRFGELGFVALFYVVASVSFAALVAYYAAHRFDGASGLALANMLVLRWLLIAVAVLGVTLNGPALAEYARLPTALFAQPIGSPRGVERITRHPFFAGAALLGLAHALLATRLTGTVFFGGLVLFSTFGAWHQDRKLLARRGAAYAGYLASTSAVPFAAIVSGRQRLVWHELPIGPLALGLGVALALRYWHDALFAAGGAWIIAVVVGGGSLAGLSAWRRSRRLAASALVATPAVARDPA